MATRHNGKFVKLRKFVANNILGKLTKFGGSSVSRSGVIGHQSKRGPQKPAPNPHPPDRPGLNRVKRVHVQA